MSQVSKYPISKEIADRIFEIFIKALVKISQEKEADEFISDLLTPTEKVMLAKRLAIAFLLEKGYDYRTIQRIIRVSSPTITSVNTALRYGSRGYKKLVSEIIKEEKVAQYFSQAVSKFLSIPAQGGVGSGLWRYLKQEVDKQRGKNRKTF